MEELSPAYPSPLPSLPAGIFGGPPIEAATAPPPTPSKVCPEPSPPHLILRCQKKRPAALANPALLPSFHPNLSGSCENLGHETETESIMSLQRERPRCQETMEHRGGHRINGQSRLKRHLAGYESSSTLLTSELETTSL